MAGSAGLPIIDTAVTAWRDALRAISAMTRLAIIVFALTVPFHLLRLLLEHRATSERLDLTIELASFLVSIADAFVTTPFVIAVHRYVLLDEVTSGYRLVPTDPRFLRFFGFTVALLALTFTPEMIWAVGTNSAHAIAFSLFLLVPMFLVILLTVVLFPSIAVDAPQSGWRNAMADTRGHCWRVFGILICTMVPMMLLVASWVVLTLVQTVITLRVLGSVPT